MSKALKHESWKECAKRSMGCGRRSLWMALTRLRQMCCMTTAMVCMIWCRIGRLLGESHCLSRPWRHSGVSRRVFGGAVPIIFRIKAGTGRAGEDDVGLDHRLVLVAPDGAEVVNAEPQPRHVR